jgi:flagellin-like protein
MKGISPVISMVLLLLMAVAAVGGAWVFIQTTQSRVQTSGEGTVKDVIGSGSTVLLLDLVTATDNGATSNDTLTIKLANPSKASARITQVVIENSTGSALYNSTTMTVSAQSFHDVVVVVVNTTDVKNYCPRNKFIRITVYSDAYTIVRQYPMECIYS